MEVVSTPQQSQQQPEYTEEQKRADFVSYQREAALASEWKKSSESNLPGIRSMAVQMGAGIASPIARAVGQGDYADQLNRLAAAAGEVQGEREKGGPVPDWLQRAARGAGVSLGTASAAGTFMGPYGIIGTFTAQEGNRAWTEGKDAGLKGKDLAEYVLKQATVEAVPAAVMQKVGLGGFESILGRGGKQAIKGAVKGAVAPGLKVAAKQAAKATGLEIGEELVTEAGHLAVSQRAGVDPEALSPESILQTAGDTVAQTVLSMGFASVPSLAAARKQEKYGKAREEILEAADSGGEVSRDKWKAWGLLKSGGLSRATRKDGVKDIAAGIRKAEQAAEAPPVAPDPAQAAQDPVQEALVSEPGIQADPAATTPPDATSIKNEFVAEQRAARGEEALPEPGVQTHEELLNIGQQKLADSPSAAGRVVEKVVKGGSALSGEEMAVLQVQYRKLTDESSAALNALVSARESGDVEAIKDATEVSEGVAQEMRDVEWASKKSGTIAGRSLAARKMMVRRDMTLGKIVNSLRAAKGGKDLSAKELIDARKISEESAENESKQAQVDEQIESQDSEAAVDEFIKESKPKKRFAKKKLPAKAEAKERAKAATAAFKAKLAQTKGPGSQPKGPGQFLAEESGAVDLELLGSEEMVELVKAHIDLGVSTFAEFFANVRSFLGDTASVAKDSLKAAWSQAQEAGLIAKPSVDIESVGSVHQFAKKTARLVVESGVTGRDEVVDAVHEELQSIDPSISRRQAIDAISGYGIFSELSKDAVTVKVRDLSGQLRQLSKLEDIQAGVKPKRTGVERREVSEEEAELTQQVREAMKEAGIGGVDDATRTKNYKKSLTKRIADLERRISEGDFSKHVKRKTVLDKEATSLKYEAKLLRGRLDAMEERFRNSQLKGFKKVLQMSGEASNLARAMKTSFDLSALLRQGKFAITSKPKFALNATRDMLRAFWSKELSFKDSEAIRERALAQFASESGLETTEVGGRLTDQEEAFRGEWAQHIPGVAGSERAYVAGLNSLRAAFFDSLVADMQAGNKWRESGQVTAEEGKGIANVVNVFTGRGRFNAQNASAAQFMSTYLFSPRFVASRFQVALGQPLWGGNARTRKLVAEQYAKSVGSMGVIYALAAIGGMFALKDEDRPQFEWDPRSTEFGKIRWGEVILDPLAGLSQIVTFLSRIASGETKKSTGEIVPLRGPDVPFKGDSISSVVYRFGRGKLAPIPSAVWNATAGENIIGEETNAFQEMIQMPVPLSMGDIYDAMRADGTTAPIALSTLALFGDGVKRYQNANAEDFAKKLAAHPELKGTSAVTGKDFDYTDAAEQIAAQAKKRGFSRGELTRAVDKAMRAAGNQRKTIRAHKRRIRKRAD
jgi:hypothetical protein